MERYIEKDITHKFEFKSYGYALEILHDHFPREWKEIQYCLKELKITYADIKDKGGNKSAIPKKFEKILFPLGWQEVRIKADLIIKKYLRSKGPGRYYDEPFDPEVIEGYIDGHNIDFLKDRVAFDLEWNSKDQTFDRDLMAMRAYYDCGIIDVGVIVTRSKDLDEIFEKLNVKGKYGASTTWMGKLIPRLDSRKNGGCPILAIGITKESVIDV